MPPRVESCTLPSNLFFNLPPISFEPSSEESESTPNSPSHYNSDSDISTKADNVKSEERPTSRNSLSSQNSTLNVPDEDCSHEMPTPSSPPSSTSTSTRQRPPSPISIPPPPPNTAEAYQPTKSPHEDVSPLSPPPKAYTTAPTTPWTRNNANLLSETSSPMSSPSPTFSAFPLPPAPQTLSTMTPSSRLFFSANSEEEAHGPRSSLHTHTRNLSTASTSSASTLAATPSHQLNPDLEAQESEIVQMKREGEAEGSRINPKELRRRKWRKRKVWILSACAVFVPAGVVVGGVVGFVKLS